MFQLLWALIMVLATSTCVLDPPANATHNARSSWHSCLAMAGRTAFYPRQSRLESRSHKLPQIIIDVKKCKLLLGLEGYQKF